MDNAILFFSLLSSILASVKKYIYTINQYNRFPKNYFRFNFTDSLIKFHIVAICSKIFENFPIFIYTFFFF